MLAVSSDSRVVNWDVQLLAFACGWLLYRKLGAEKAAGGSFASKNPKIKKGTQSGAVLVLVRRGAGSRVEGALGGCQESCAWGWLARGWPHTRLFWARLIGRAEDRCTRNGSSGDLGEIAQELRDDRREGGFFIFPWLEDRNLNEASGFVSPLL